MKCCILLLALPFSVFAEDDLKAQFTAYFEAETQAITDQCLADIQTREDWESKAETYRDQLAYMLGLDPMPERTPLKPVVTGTIEREGIVVEKLHFQSSPGLYVTGNLYRPKEVKDKLPAVLYVCGHGRVKKKGVSYGNKTHYQHHGSWFARNGYVCLVIDTIQLGEIEGIHHGTYKYKMWWWNSRGYTPAGVEAWNGIRSIDYLQARPEVDGERIGVTGRSGGGAYSWWIAALDKRVKCAVPVAGITSMKNHVVDGCIEGHCDCMYMVNSHRWDFPQVAALVAPRPLLISNTDKDRIFPLDGVVDVYTKTKRIYNLLGASKKIGLHITEGPHSDTQELRIHAFRWLNRWLKDDDSLITIPAEKLFEVEELKVFDELPEDEIVTKIHETFVKKETDAVDSFRLEDMSINQRHPFAKIEVFNQTGEVHELKSMSSFMEGLDERTITHLRRRHALLGESLGVVYFKRVCQQISESQVMHMKASGPEGITALLAVASNQGAIQHLSLSGLPSSMEEGPEFLNLARFMTVDELKRLIAPKVDLIIEP